MGDFNNEMCFGKSAFKCDRKSLDDDGERNRADKKSKTLKTKLMAFFHSKGLQIAANLFWADKL